MTKICLVLLALLPLSCAHPSGSPPNAAPNVPAMSRADLPQLSRAEFNRLAALENVPLYWLEGPLAPESFVERKWSPPSAPERYITDGAFTPAFDALYVRLVNRRRIEAVRRELDSGWPIAITTDLRDASESDREVVRILAEAAQLIEELYATQRGTAAIPTKPVDPPSRELLRRSQGFWCEGPQTQNDPFCHGLITFDDRLSDAYPRDRKQDATFCEQLRKAPNSKALLDPFSVVREKNGGLVSVPYTQVYGARMKQVAGKLREAAQTLPPNEAAFKEYLRAAAHGFETNDWDSADEAWVAMNSENSAWYLRIAPDEVYFDPCNSKAGFHVSFAKINTSLLEWQHKLTPLRKEMEASLAQLIGKPYRARPVVFSLPDFIDIILNAGDSRNAFGATVGQSLPNWGPVSARGDGRTVVMTNLYENPDSRAVDREKARLLLHPDTAANLSEDPISRYLDILLHEATHNFGPHSDYQIDGKRPTQIFGGSNASIMEELKAQTGALWYVAFLRQHGLIDATMAKAAKTGSVMWCFGQMSRGLFFRDGKRAVYPTLAAIQVGYFMEQGALVFESIPDAEGNAEDGRFRIDFDKLTVAIESLLQNAGQIKATGDAKAAEELISRYTSESAQEAYHLRLIADRILRFPKESFSYAIVY